MDNLLSLSSQFDRLEAADHVFMPKRLGAYFYWGKMLKAGEKFLPTVRPFTLWKLNTSIEFIKAQKLLIAMGMNKIFVVFLFAIIFLLRNCIADDDQLDLAQFDEIAKRPNMVIGRKNRPTGKKRSSIRIHGRLVRQIAILVSDYLQKEGQLDN